MLALQRDSVGACWSVPIDVGNVFDIRIIKVTISKFIIAVQLKIHGHGFVVLWTRHVWSSVQKGKSSLGVVSVNVEHSDDIILEVATGKWRIHSLVVKASKGILAFNWWLIEWIADIEVYGHVPILGLVGWVSTNHWLQKVERTVKPERAYVCITLNAVKLSIISKELSVRLAVEVGRVCRSNTNGAEDSCRSLYHTK